jgi:hypothetical protein
MICPNCNGKKTAIASHVLYSNGTGAFGVDMPCHTCEGAGEVDDRMPQWNELGRKLREKRMTPYRNLCTEAARRGMTVLQLSRMEQGKIEPILEDE